MSEIISPIIRDDEETYTRDFFYPVDFGYKPSSFKNNEAKLKGLIRHQIDRSLSSKNTQAYFIELTTVYKQTMVIGYFQTKVFLSSPYNVDK